MSKRVLVPFREFERTVPYARALAAVGIEPQLASVGSPISLDHCSGLMLMGGTDVNPSLYGQAPQPDTDPADDERDRVESEAIDVALSRDLPILAICRGLQILNVRLGGTLVQHLKSVDHHRRRTPDNPGRPAHVVTIEPDTLLARIAGRQAWSVNSRHHQAIAKVGQDLRVSARDPGDGTIEAIEIPTRRFVLGVQWHPEDQAPNDPEQMKLFQRFAEAL